MTSVPRTILFHPPTSISEFALLGAKRNLRNRETTELFGQIEFTNFPKITVNADTTKI